MRRIGVATLFPARGTSVASSASRCRTLRLAAAGVIVATALYWLIPERPQLYQSLVPTLRVSPNSPRPLLSPKRYVEIARSPPSVAPVTITAPSTNEDERE